MFTKTLSDFENAKDLQTYIVNALKNEDFCVHTELTEIENKNILNFFKTEDGLEFLELILQFTKERKNENN